MIPGISGADFSLFIILQGVLTLLFFVLLLFFPKIMLWQIDRKLQRILTDLDTYRIQTEDMFKEKLTTEMTKNTENRLETIKNTKFSPPTSLDPAGIVNKLEHVLDNTENKFTRFIENHGETENTEEKADLQMALKGVMGTNQIYKVMRHFRILIKETRNIQLIGLIRMMIPVYVEIAESQKDATKAFLDEAPIGDSIGPLVAAKFIKTPTEEIEEISENIIHSKETINEEQEAHIIKSNGPGARLGKYGDAIETITKENNINAIITIDAALKLEGETTGQISEGIGVMMGGPGVEKTKIEEAAQTHEIPLEGVIIKQNAKQASQAMRKEIYDSYKDAKKHVEELAQEFNGPVLIVGVGNTCGIGNNEQSTKGIHNTLRKYWKEYEEQEEETSYMGLMSTLPMGENTSKIKEKRVQNIIYYYLRC